MSNERKYVVVYERDDGETPTVRYSRVFAESAQDAADAGNKNPALPSSYRVMELVEPEPLPEPLWTVKMHGWVQAEGATPDRPLAEGGAQWHRHNCTRDDLTVECSDPATLVVSCDGGKTWAPASGVSG